MLPIILLQIVQLCNGIFNTKYSVIWHSWRGHKETSDIFIQDEYDTVDRYTRHARDDWWSSAINSYYAPARLQWSVDIYQKRQQRRRIRPVRHATTAGPVDEGQRPVWSAGCAAHSSARPPTSRSARISPPCRYDNRRRCAADCETVWYKKLSCRREAARASYHWIFW